MPCQHTSPPCPYPHRYLHSAPPAVVSSSITAFGEPRTLAAYHTTYYSYTSSLHQIQLPAGHGHRVKVTITMTTVPPNMALSTRSARSLTLTPTHTAVSYSYSHCSIEATASCQLDMMLLYEVFDSTDTKLLYPVNTLRNFARMQVCRGLCVCVCVWCIGACTAACENGRAPGCGHGCWSRMSAQQTLGTTAAQPAGCAHQASGRPP